MRTALDVAYKMKTAAVSLILMLFNDVVPTEVVL